VLADSVRASSADGPVRLSYLVALAFGGSGAGNEVWINIAKVGEWQGHPRGPFQFTPAVFDQIVANTQSRVTPINCDYEHQTFRKLTGGIPSAGKIIRVERRGDELWALAELTDRAASMVRAGEYRTCSPVIEFDSKDRVSGKDIGPELLSLALTNDPFQDGLHPIKLTRIAMAETAADDDKKKKEADAAALSSTAGAPTAGGGVTVTVTPQGGISAAPTGGDETSTVTLADPPTAAPADAESADDAGVDANAVFDSIAEAAGVDKATVLGWLADNLDQLVNMIQAGVAKDGTAADNSKAMSRIAAAVGDLRALKVELRVKDQTVEKLNSQVVALTSRLEQVEKQHIDEKAASIKAHVLSLQAKGFVGPEAQDVEDACFLFSQNHERAARTYGRQIVPVGTMQTDDERNPNVPSGPVTLDSLSDKERATVEMMIRAGVVKDTALETISARRAAGKGN
jgi:phage I-like protein